MALQKLIRFVIPKNIKYGIEVTGKTKSPYVGYEIPLKNGDSVSFKKLVNTLNLIILPKNCATAWFIFVVH